MAKEKFDDFMKHLGKLGFKFEERPNQMFLARYDRTVINLYSTGSVVLDGDEKGLKDVMWYLESELGAKRKADDDPGYRGKTRVGTDEVGKGDVFGPIIVAGVFIDTSAEEKLKKAGVKDSKLVKSDSRIAELSAEIKRIVGRDGYSIVKMNPPKYNELYTKFGNLNELLGWMHSQAIGNIIMKNPGCKVAITDKFEDKNIVEKALEKKKIKIELVKITKGGRDIAIASASILARDEFLRGMKKFSEDYSLELPKGAANPSPTIEEFIRKHGKKELANVAKLNFSIFEKMNE